MVNPTKIGVSAVNNSHKKIRGLYNVTRTYQKETYSYLQLMA